MLWASFFIRSSGTNHRLPNPHLAHVQEHFLYHLGISSATTDIPATFKDVKVVIVVIIVVVMTVVIVLVIMSVNKCPCACSTLRCQSQCCCLPQFVCIGGTASRMEELAQHLAGELGLLLNGRSDVMRCSPKTERYSLFKVGPVLCASVSLCKAWSLHQSTSFPSICCS